MYHGLAGHFLVVARSDVLKVRIVAEMDDRVRLMMERKNVSEDQALRYQKRLTSRKWSLHLYGIDTHEPTLYDLVIRIKKAHHGRCGGHRAEQRNFLAWNRFRPIEESAAGDRRPGLCPAGRKWP